MAAMAMPKTTIYDDHRMVLGEYNIRCAGKTPIMGQVTKASGKKTLSQEQLELRIFAPNSRHHPAACFWRNDVHCFLSVRWQIEQ